MSDEFYNKNMRIGADGVCPEFYKKYVVDVQNIIESNARKEFECIWREQETHGGSRLAIADKLSTAITTMSAQLSQVCIVFIHLMCVYMYVYMYLFACYH